MATLLQFDFPFDGPFGAEMAQALEGLARSIAEEPGLLWKIWTENATARMAGGIYLFETPETAAAYAQKHCERLAGFGVRDVRAQSFEVNAELSRLTRAPGF
ncbi:MAG TPA: monooxygenase [Gammaproteobacteria bacterium]|nr:monooxygenase [Gammaproteobacteria bacterium]